MRKIVFMPRNAHTRPSTRISACEFELGLEESELPSLVCRTQQIPSATPCVSAGGEFAGTFSRCLMSAPPSAVVSPFALHLWEGLSAAAGPLPAASPLPVTRVVSLGVGEGGKGVVKPPCQAGTMSAAVVFTVLLFCPQSHCGPSPKRDSRASPGLA